MVLIAPLDSFLEITAFILSSNVEQQHEQYQTQEQVESSINFLPTK